MSLKRRVDRLEQERHDQEARAFRFAMSRVGPLSDRERQALDRELDYTLAHPDEPLTLARLAEIGGLTVTERTDLEAHFARAFNGLLEATDEQ